MGKIKNNSKHDDHDDNRGKNNSERLDPEAAGIVLGGKEKPIKKDTLAKWRVQKIGPVYIKVGRLVRYEMSDLVDYLEKKRNLH